MAKIEVNTIDTISGSTNLTIGSTNSSTVTFENGAVTGHNYPTFQVIQSSEQSIPVSTYTKLTFGTENWDIGSCYDLTNSKFVVPTGMGGKYYFYARYLIRSNNDKEYIISFYVNGSVNALTESKEITGSAGGAAGAQTMAILDLDAGDEVEAYVYHTSLAAKNTYTGYTSFAGMRIGS